jgi:hypothetical protein
MKNKSPVNIYFKVVAVFVCLSASFGWVLPFIISSKTDELPILGFIYLVSIPVVIYYSIKSIYKQLKSNQNEKK